MLHYLPRLRNKAFFVISAGLLLFAGFVFLWITHCGIGYTFDSYHYEAAARNWAAYRKLLDKDGVFFEIWPPLYPILLSLGAPDVAVYAKHLHLFCLLGSLAIWFKMAAIHFSDKSDKLVFMVFAALATPYYMTHSFLWSEAAFLLLMNLGLLSACFFFRDWEKRFLLMACIFFGMMLMQRTAGIIIASVFFGYLLYTWKKNDKHTKNLTVGFFALCFVLCFTAFTAWNGYKLFFLQKTEFVSGVIAIKSYWVNFLNYGASLGGWFVPNNFSVLFRWAVGWFSLSLTLFFHFKFGLHSKGKIFGQLLALIVAVYFLAMLVLNPGMEADTERYLSVIYMPFLFLGFGLLSYFKNIPSLKKWVYVFLLMLACYQTFRLYKNAELWRNARCQTISIQSQ